MYTYESDPVSFEQVRQVRFTGDQVRLAGQIDYPAFPSHSTGYPLIFILQHACCTGLSGHAHYAQLGNACGYAVFRWDKRGTGKSGSGGFGSTTVDALNAFRAATRQPNLDLSHIVILAQNEGTLLLAENFAQFSEIAPIKGAILAGNMVDAQHIASIKTNIHIVQGEKDIHSPSKYAVDVIRVHKSMFDLASSCYIAENANRRLRDVDTRQFHAGAHQTIGDWLESI